MGLPRDRVLADGHTPHHWERKAIEYIKSALPNEHPYNLWALVELVEPSGRRHEIDALVLGHNALYLIEIKSHPARFWGNSVNWNYAFFDDGRSRVMECPMNGASRKARALAGLLERAFHGKRPRIEPLVFLSDEKVDASGLDGTGRLGVVTRKNFVRAITAAEFDGALSSLQDRVVDAVTARETIQALGRLGIIASKGQRKLGDLLIEEVIDEGSGYQDHLARHESLELLRRARIYLVAQSSTSERQDQLKRAATREARILSALSHPHVLKCLDFKADGPTGGPCLVFEHDEKFERLDRFIQRNPTLSFADRLTILRQVGEAVAYCHQRTVLHRGIDPTSVLVRGGGDDGPIDTRLFNFQLAQQDDVRGTVHLSALSDTAIYRAPELLDDPQKADARSDVFSLGALAWFVFVGRAPAASLAERQERLFRDRKLSLAHAGEEAAALKVERKRGAAEKYRSLDDLIGFATELSRDARCDTPLGFVDLLGHILVAGDDDRAPISDAVSGDVIRDDEGTELLVERLLGTGSTARVFRVSDSLRKEFCGALKVALDPEFDPRLEEEARILGRARGDRIIALKQTLRFQGRCALLLEDAGETLAAELLRSGVSLEDARRWGHDLLLAVERLEDLGILHKDIKPANIGFSVGASSSTRHLTLFDFSLAAIDERDILAGTPAYRDPFLSLRGRWDAAADRWSVAVSLYEMLTGRLPTWRGDDGALGSTSEVVLEAERFDPSARESLATFFEKALAREVTRRFPSAESMREAWMLALLSRPSTASVEREAPPDEGPDTARKAEPTWPEKVLAGVHADTPVEALPLSNRGRNALDRAQILTFGALHALPRNQLQQLKGVGRGTLQEIVAFREAWRRLQGATPPSPVAPVAPVTSDVGDAQPTTPSEWIAAFVPTSRGRGKTWVQDVRALFGLDDGPPMDAAALAKQRGVSRQLVYIHVAEARTVWRNTPLLPALHRVVSEALAAQGNVTAATMLAEAVARACGAPSSQALDAKTLVHGLALVEIARMTDDTLSDGILHGARWIATDRTLLDLVRALGAEADRLASRDVLPGAEEARTQLEPVVRGTDLARLSLDRLLPLAARASRNAVCSARLELYPREMPAERALRLCAGVFTDLAYDEALLRTVVARRYAEALPLPARPDLDALVEKVLGLRFEPTVEKYLRAKPTETLSSVTHAPAVAQPAVRPAAVTALRAFTFDDPVARDFDERLRVAAQRCSSCSRATSRTPTRRSTRARNCRASRCPTPPPRAAPRARRGSRPSRREGVTHGADAREARAPISPPCCSGDASPRGSSFVGLRRCAGGSCGGPRWWPDRAA